MKKGIQGFAMAASMMLVMASQAEYVWVGAAGGGDGVNFSDARNWQNENAPKGKVDEAILFNDGGTFNNDLAGLEIRTIQFNSTQPVTLNGNEIAFYDVPVSGYNSLSNGANLTVNCPISVAYNKQIKIFPGVQTTAGSGIRFYGEITLTMHACVDIIGPEQQTRADEIWFYGPVNGGYNSRFRIGFGKASKTYFKNEVHVGVIESYGVTRVYNQSPISFDSTGNTYTNLVADYKRIYTGCANALYAKSPIEFRHSYGNGNNYYDFQGYDQEAAGVTAPSVPANPGHTDQINSDRPMTLSLTGSSDYLALAVVMGKVTLRWAPNGNFTQTFQDSANTTKGDIIVEGGIFETAGTCTFASVPRLVVKSGAVFKVAAGASDPFGASTGIAVELEKGAKIELENGATITLNTVSYDGLPVKADSFTSANAEWIQGNGTATVRTDADAGSTYWTAKASGDWETAANWSRGVPTDSLPAFVTYAGTEPYTVSVNGTGITMPPTTVGGRATVEIKSTATINTTFNIEEGGTLKGAGDAVVTLTDSTAPASRRFKQSGGKIDFSGNAAFCPLTTYWYTTFGRGQTRFSGNARMETSNGKQSLVFTRSDRAGEENAAVVTIADNAWLANPGGTKYCTFVLDGGVDGGFGTFVVDSTPAADHLCGNLIVGHQYGKAFFDLRKACLNLDNDDNGRLEVGGFSHTYAAEQAIYYGDALMRVATGACVRVRGSQTNAGYNGVWVGDNVTTRTGDMLGSGKLWLDGGVLTNRYGATVVGAGQAKGTVLLTGGEYCASATKSDDFHTVIGLSGGQGEWIVSNGAVRVKKDVYVGGMQVSRTSYKFSNDFYGERHNATGALTVAKAADGDCLFATEGKIVVADDGTGSVTVGAGGDIRAAAMELSNANAALDFAVGAAGAGKVTLSGALTVGTGAKVRIRDTGCGEKSVTLVNAAAIAGLSAADVEVDGPAAAKVALVRGKLKYYPFGPSGLTVILR